MKYTGAGNAGAASTTAATAGIIKLEQGATVVPLKLYEFEIAPQAAAADNNYGVRFKRQTTAGTWTGVTPAALDGINARASAAVCGIASTAAGTAVSNSELLRLGFAMRAGYRWVSVPGGEFIVAPTTAYGILAEYIYAQSTDVLSGSFTWEE